MQKILLTIGGVLLACLVLMASFTSANPGKQEDRRIINARRRLLQYNSFQKCLYQMDSCNPYHDRCCSGMKCANIIGGFCLKGAEKCICVPEGYGDIMP